MDTRSRGVPCLHPGLYGDDALVRAVIEEALSRGLKSIIRTMGREKRYLEMAEAYGLIVTAGSDYHGERRGQVFHGDIGDRQVSIQVLDELQQARAGAKLDNTARVSSGIRCLCSGGFV